MQNDIQPILSDDQVDLRELFRVLRDGRKLIFSFSAVFASLLLLVALMMPEKYESSSVLAPVKPQVDVLPRMLTNFGGLASLAGLGAGSSDDEARIALEIVQSWSFIEGFIERNNLKVQVFAVDGWDSKTNSLIIDDSIYDEAAQKWLIEVDGGQTRAPTSWELFKRFSAMLTILPDLDAGMVKLSVEHYSPFVAKQIVDLIFVDINNYMQQRQLHKVNSNIKYLQAQIEQTSISNMEAVFYSIIEEQVKSKMLTEATPEHTFVLVSKSMVPEKKSGPKRIFLLIAGSILGVILSIFLVLVRHAFRNSSHQLSK